MNQLPVELQEMTDFLFAKSANIAKYFGVPLTNQIQGMTNPLHNVGDYCILTDTNENEDGKISAFIATILSVQDFKELDSKCDVQAQESFNDLIHYLDAPENFKAYIYFDDVQPIVFFTITDMREIPYSL